MKNFLVLLVISAMCCALWTMADAQSPMIVFDQITEEDGLPNVLNHHIYQDRDGLLWFASTDGVISYNGYDFNNYRHDPQDSTTISTNRVQMVFEDRERRLWVGAFSGETNVSDPFKQVFTALPLEKDKSVLGVHSSTVYAICQDKFGNMWLAGSDGIDIFQYDGRPQPPVGIPPNILEQIAQIENGACLFQDADEIIWAGTHQGIIAYDPNTQTLTTPENNLGFPSFSTQHIAQAQDGAIWAGFARDETRLFYLKPGASAFKPFPHCDHLSRHWYKRDFWFAFDHDGRLWVSVFAEKCYGFDFRDSTIFFDNKFNSNITQERFLRGPFVDHEGNVWIPGDGFHVYDYPRGFHQYENPFGIRLANNNMSILDGELWFAYRESGVVRVDPNDLSATLLAIESDAPHNLISNHIGGMIKLSTGNIALAGFNHLMIYNREQGLMYTTHVSGTNRGILEDSKNRLWMGGYRGLYQFTLEGELVRRDSFPAYLGIEGSAIQTLAEDDEGKIWFSSYYKGIGNVDPETYEYEHIFHEEGNPNSLASNTTNDLVLNGDILWVATDAGLTKLNIKTRQFKTYDSDHNLENEYLLSVVLTPQGPWVSTNAGLSFLDLKTERFTNYTTSDGLANKQYYARCRMLAPDGTVYFGGKKGVDFFHPDQLRPGYSGIKMHLEKLKANQKDIDPMLCSQEGGIQLNYDEDVIEVDFAGITYASPEFVQYAYRMEGLDDGWIDIGETRSVNIANLEPGEYTFKARARHPHREWSSQLLEIPIYIKPPFWKTGWFQIGAGLLVILTLLALVKYREERIKAREQKENEIQRRMIVLEKRALLAQMNPHFIFNSMNSIQEFIASRDIEGALKYLSKFSRLLRFVLNMSSENRITLSDEIKLIEDYLELENMRFPNKFNYKISVDPFLDPHTMEIPPFLIQPQVENAIRHGLMNKGDKGHLSIAIDKVDDHIKVTVEDDGIGRKAAAELKRKSSFHQKSKGLSIVEERLRHINKNAEYHKIQITDMYNGTDTAKGTRVEIFLPID